MRPGPARLVLALLVTACDGTMTASGGRADSAVDGDGSTPAVRDGGASSDGAPLGDAAARVDASTGTDAGTDCPAPLGPPAIVGTTYELAPGESLADLLASVESGDEIVVQPGDHGDVEVRDLAFEGWVVVRAGSGEAPSFGSLWLERVSGVYFEGLSYSETVTVQSGERVTFDGVTIDVGPIDGAAFHVRGRGGSLGSRDVTLRRSRIVGGGRTVFLHSLFTPPDEWNQRITLAENDFSCMERGCVQISGARGVTIEDNTFRDSLGYGVLMAGAIDVDVRRNRFVGVPGASSGAVRIATPGREWDDFDGVEHMISEDVRVANNLITDFGTGIELSAARRVDIVFNTVTDGRGLYTWHRTPHDRSGAVILEGNSDYRVWNNVLSEVQIDAADPRPTLESHNAARAGGAGEGLITGDPGLAADGTLLAGSPLHDAALVHPDNPAGDFEGRLRGSAPDIGAVEDGAAPGSCTMTE